MSQIWVYDRELNKKDVIISDFEIKVYDCITPQLTTFEVGKNSNISESDIVILKDDKEFVGIVDSVSVGDTLEVSIYPIEHVFDNDLDIDNLDGSTDVVTYLENQIDKNFVTTDDYLMYLPIQYTNTLSEPIQYKTIIDSSNLLEIINDIYLNTGVYMEYVPIYSDGRLSNIKIVFKNVADNDIRKIRYDNPQIIEKVTYDYSHTSSNKVTITADGKKYKIYLREDNQLTSNPKDEFRIKKVINKNIDFKADEEINSLDEMAEAIIVLAQKELQGDVFGYQITFVMLNNPRRIWNYRQACVFTAPDRTFYSLVTRIEYLSNKHIKITLGAYRTKLHEKIQKMLKKPKEVGNTLGGISVTNAFGQYLYWFEQDTEGNLYICSENLTPEQLSAMFELDTNKDLYVNYADNQRQSLSIDNNGNLQGSY